MLIGCLIWGLFDKLGKLFELDKIHILGAYDTFPDFFVWAFKIGVDS